MSNAPPTELGWARANGSPPRSRRHVPPSFVVEKAGSDEIRSAPAAGGDSQPVVGALHEPEDLMVDSGFLTYLDNPPEGARVVTRSLAGGDPRTLAEGEAGSKAHALDADHCVWFAAGDADGSGAVMNVSR